MNKTFRPCVIHVGDNQALSAAVQRELFARGWKWLFFPKLNDPMHTSSNYLYAWEDGDICYSNSGNQVPNYPPFDLAAQPLAMLLDYLDKPEGVKLPFNAEVHPSGEIVLNVSQSHFVHIEADQMDKLYAASQAARKEGK